MPESEFVTLSEHVRTKLVEGSTFVIPNVDLEYVIKRLSTQPNKATGVDGISAKLLKLSAIHIATPLTYIIKLGLRMGVMPTHWKQARVCPIYKSGDRSECNNYRPISVLCGVSKIVERHVHGALYTYLTEHNLLFTAVWIQARTLMRDSTSPDDGHVDSSHGPR